MFIDVHAHIYDEYYDNIDEIVKNAKDYTVEKILNNAVDIKTSKEVIELSKKFPNVYACIGIHPENIDDLQEDYLEVLEKLANENNVVAIGEIGLDYHYTKENKDKQKQVFLEQLKLADKLNLPVIIHSRDAVGDVIEILTDNKNLIRNGGVIHCFGGSVESAKILHNLGFSFSFGGVCTFNNAQKVIMVIESLPLDSLMFETDCPYMTPVPHRGERNEPKYVVNIAEKVALIKGVDIQEIGKITTLNAERIFKI
ncbi:MAG: TatD family hydrolase [Clostridia bacterium]|nr:TatD family hydrolase [Clostridia bacterium]